MINVKQSKEKLELEKKTLVEELNNLGTFDKEHNTWRAMPIREEGEAEESDENDLATIAEGYEERSSTLSTLQNRLDDVSSALIKIENGTYGMCEVCNEQINEDRLEANSASPTCTAHINQ